MSLTQSSRAKIDINFKWADYQWEIVDALENEDIDVAVLRIGYGGGKSYCGAQWIHAGSIDLESGESLVLAPSFQEGQTGTFRVLFETLPGEHTVPNDAEGHPENSPIVAGYNDMKKRLTYISGHVVRLGSADKWNRYAGSEFNRIWCDEVAHYGTTNLYDLHEMLVSRQRTKQGPNTTLWTSTGNGFNQFYDITYEQVDGSGDPLPWKDYLKVVVESSLNSPFLTERDKEKLKRQFEGTLREEQALHGGFHAPEGLVHSWFEKPKHVRGMDWMQDELTREERGRLIGEYDRIIYGQDWGFSSDPAGALAIAVKNGSYYVLDEFKERGLTNQELAKQMKGWYDDHDSGPVYCDPAEPKSIEVFNRNGIDALKADNSVSEGLQAVKSASDELYVAEHCSKLINEFGQYRYKDDPKDDSDVVKAHDHLMDALRYALIMDYEQGGVSVNMIGGDVL